MYALIQKDLAVLPSRLNGISEPADAKRTGSGTLQKATVTSDGIVDSILSGPVKLFAPY